MTIDTLFTRLQTLHPHQYSDSELMYWLNLLEIDMADFLNIFSATEFTEHTAKTEELLTDAYDVYLYWLYANICEANEEYDRYSAQATLYTSALDSWKSRYIKNHVPLSNGRYRNLL